MFSTKMIRTTCCLALTVVVAAIWSQATGEDKTQEKPMLRHVVMFKFKDSASAADITKIETEFMALRTKIDNVVDLEWGTNNSPEGLSKGFTHCFFVTFADEKGREAYLPHAAHAAFVDILKPHLDDVLVVDYIAKK